MAAPALSWPTLALERCAACDGAGWVDRRSGHPCKCVYRRIFRACLDTYRKSRDGVVWQVRYLLGANCKPGYSGLCDRPREEFAADFWLIARRTLAPREWRVLQMHFLQGLDHVACCRKLKMERGPFFHAVYRLEYQLGRAFLEARPYALFPPSAYFATRTG